MRPPLNGENQSIDRKAGRILIASVLLVPGLQWFTLNPQAAQLPPSAKLVQLNIDNLAELPPHTTEDPKLKEQYKRAEEQRKEQLRLEQEAKEREERERLEEEQRRAVTPPHDQYSGNAYTPGQCTWYVASRRNVPSFWGNAVNWLANAQAAGFATGTEPRVGAIAWTGVGYAGHVAIVEQVSAQGVLISEMNALYGPYNVDQRWTSASEFRYIY